MNILIPMVLSNTNINEGSGYPKALYEIAGKTILEYISDSLNRIKNANFIFVVQQTDIIRYHIDNTLKLLFPNCKIVQARGVTNGAACSCLLAIDLIDNAAPLLIAGSDHILNDDLNKLCEGFISSVYDGVLVIFKDVHPRWSYVRLDDDGLVIETAEKNPISNNAVAGYYYFKQGNYFVKAAKKMILKRDGINGQYYICPVCNEMILCGKSIGVHKVDKENCFSFRSEKDIEYFENFIQAGSR